MKRRWSIVLILAAAMFLAGRLLAAEPSEKGVVATTPEAAGQEFRLQGEFEGRPGAATKLGVQIIALGKGKFQAVFLPGGLPGAGWDRKTRIEQEGRLEGANAVFPRPASGGFEVVTDGQKLTGKNEKNEMIELQKVIRQSPTVGAKPPQGAIVLFDGSNADAWNGGKLDARNLLVAGVLSKQKFKDFALHVEFTLPFMPDARGQGRGNSGVYMQNRYELQVLDSFGLKGEDNECGGIYHVAAPAVNMCFPPLSWQTYDIDFTAAKWDENGVKTQPATATIKHNGVTIHDKVEIKGPTGGGEKETPSPGSIQLQNHGNPVFFRNIWIVEKK
jgi:hypothetical protein